MYSRYDRYMDIPDGPDPVGECPMCKEPIYEGESVLNIDDKVICEDNFCFEKVLYLMSEETEEKGECFACNHLIEDDEYARKLSFKGKDYLFHEDCLSYEYKDLFKVIGLVKEETSEKWEPDWDLIGKDQKL